MAGDGTVSWRELRTETIARLRAAGGESPEVDARRIVEEASGWEGSDHHLHLDDPATDKGVVRLDRMVARRAVGEPLQYVLGRWGFRTLDLAVDPRALIPRPETEQVTGVALSEIDRLVASRDSGVFVAVDLGTGSGAIALSLVAERERVEVVATDRSADALALARANLAGLGGRAATRVTLAEGDWYRALPDDVRGRVDLIVSNPPYVAASEELPTVVHDWEPVGALVSGPTGFEAIEVIVAGADEWLAPDGVLVVEIGATQGPVARELAVAAGLGGVAVHLDLAGRARVLRASAAGRPRGSAAPS